MDRVEIFTKAYMAMSDEELQNEIDNIFDRIFAILEVSESDSIESYPNPNIRLKFSCEVLKDQTRDIQ